MNNYVISEFARLRKNEIVDLPGRFDIHADYLEHAGAEELADAFRVVHSLFHTLFADIAEHPEKFGLPLYTTGETRMGAAYNEARFASDWLFYLLLFLFANGGVKEGRFVVDIPAFRRSNKGPRAVKHAEVLLGPLAGYGFVFDGLKNGKIPAKAFEIAFPAKPAVLTVLHLMAEKCLRFDGPALRLPREALARHGFVRFYTWNHRVLAEPRAEMLVGTGGDHVADSLHNKTDKAFVLAFHDAATAEGLACAPIWIHEGIRERYHEHGDDACLFETSLDNGNVTLKLRIRNAEACMDYLANCPESVKDIFRQTHNGCAARRNGTCFKSVRYVYEGEEKWRCGCWGAPFSAPPAIANIPHYLKLVELGKKKAASKRPVKSPNP